MCIRDRVIKSAVEKNRFDARFLSRYEHMWKSKLAGEIKLQLFARKMYRRFTNRDIDEFFIKFGYDISCVRNFDYDMLSTIAQSISKLELAKYFLPRLGLII